MSEVVVRSAVLSDIDALDVLEQEAFSSDRLSRRRLKHWIQAENRVFYVAEKGEQLLGYALVLLLKGTRLARLYSLAVSQAARGQGVGRQLLVATEAEAARQQRLYMRLEVASDNQGAIGLYQSLGYSAFGCLPDYYEDHRDALRMQKRIRYLDHTMLQRETPWYQQSTEFTCGPAALMMAMASLQQSLLLTRQLELTLWRQATTIYMTSGHGGCHPIGLAIAAQQRGFAVEVFLNQTGALFVEGVRSTHKKEVLQLVDQGFREEAAQLAIPVHPREVSQDDIAGWLNEQAAVIMLISTYRIDGKKAPHWVVVTAVDEHCLYVHDPEPSDEHHLPLDCQYVPIARADFAKMSSFGTEKLRTCVVLRNT